MNHDPIREGKTLALTPQLRKEIAEMVNARIAEVVHPMKLTVNSIEQTVAGIDIWRKEFWGNGSGREGYIDKARREDKERYVDLFKKIDELQRLRADELAVELYKERKHKKFEKWAKLTIPILGSGAGAWLLHLLAHFYHFSGN